MFDLIHYSWPDLCFTETLAMRNKVRQTYESPIKCLAVVCITLGKPKAPTLSKVACFLAKGLCDFSKCDVNLCMQPSLLSLKSIFCRI